VVQKGGRGGGGTGGSHLGILSPRFGEGNRRKKRKKGSKTVPLSSFAQGFEEEGGWGRKEAAQNFIHYHLHCRQQKEKKKKEFKEKKKKDQHYRPIFSPIHSGNSHAEGREERKRGEGSPTTYLLSKALGRGRERGERSSGHRCP